MKKDVRKLFTFLGMIILIAAAAAQKPNFVAAQRGTVDAKTPAYKPIKELSGNMASVGTDTMEDVMKFWIADFTKLYPKVSISRESKGSMTAEPALTAGTAQLAPLSRELMPDEMKRFQEKYGYEPLVVKVALGSYNTQTRTAALTFYVNENNPVSKLNLPQLRAMYCTGGTNPPKQDITTWGQLGATGEWANKPIKLVGVAQPDGVSNNMQLMLCKDGLFKAGIQELKIDHTPGVKSVLYRIVTEVVKDSSAIGYGAFYGKQPGAKALAIAETEKSPYLTGSFEEVTSARFPLTRYIYILVNRPPGKPLDANVKEFLKFVLSREGQKSVEKEGVFLPLPAAIAKKELAKLK